MWKIARDWLIGNRPWVSRTTAEKQLRDAVAREREEFSKYREEGLAEDRKKLRGLIALLTRIELDYQSNSLMVTIHTSFDGRMFHSAHKEDRDLLAHECARRVEYQLRDIRTLLIESQRRRYAV